MEYICIILFTLIAWWRVIYAGYVVDDAMPEKRGGKVYTLIQQFKKNHDWKEVVTRVRGVFYGTSMFKNICGDHIASLCIHIIVSCLIYRCLGNNRVAFISALLFCVNPITNQVSCWCNGKRYGIAACLSLLLYAIAPAGILIYLLIPFSHASAILAPLLLLYKGYWWILFVAPILGVFGYPFMYKWYLARKKMIGYSYFFEFDMRKVVMCVKRFNFFLWHIIMPKSCGMYLGYQHYFGTRKDETDKALSVNSEFLLSLCTLLVVLITMIYMWNTPVGFGLFWYCLFIAQWCGMITVTQTIVERVMYLPAIGLCLVMGYFISIFPILFIPMATIYVMKSWDVLKQYGSVQDMLDYNIFNNPDSPHCFISNITNAYDAGMLEEGFTWAKKAVIAFPEDAYINLLYTAGLVGIKDFTEAKKWILRSQIKMRQTGIKPDISEKLSREQYLFGVLSLAIKKDRNGK